MGEEETPVVLFKDVVDETLEARGRSLASRMKGPKTKSNMCKTECIDQEKVFCPTDNYAGGICCEKDEFCQAGKDDYDPAFYQSVAWCSNRSPNAPNWFKFIVCPNELTCGDNGRKFISPPTSGQAVTREIDKHVNLFLDNDICSWVIRNPSGMGAKDWMWVEITRVDRCMVYITKAYDYRYKSRNQPQKAAGRKFGMLKGLDYYVAAQAVSQFPAFLRLRTWIEGHVVPDH